MASAQIICWAARISPLRRSFIYTPQEIELIRQYRMLDERGRRSVEGALRFEQEWSYRQKK